MRKKIILSIIAISTLGITFCCIIFLFRSTSINIPEAEIIPMESQQESAMESSSFSKTDIEIEMMRRATKKSGGSYVFFQGFEDGELEQSALLYDMRYYPEAGTVSISVYRTPFAEWRIVAENMLLETLGISRQQACELDVTIGTIREIDYEASGKNFPLSFCE